MQRDRRKLLERVTKMNALSNLNQRTFQFMLASSLALGVATMSGNSVAATVSSTVAVGATLVAACEVTPNATISFGNVTTLLSAGSPTANSVATFQVACSSDASPEIYTLDDRIMVGPGAEELPFNLSLTNTGTNDFPSGTGTPLVAAGFTQDGTMKSVVLYAKILAANFTGANAKPAGAYAVNLTVSVNY
jgi:spore coat protein U-like protein